jgi:hypothetical protein
MESKQLRRRIFEFHSEMNENGDAETSLDCGQTNVFSDVADSLTLEVAPSNNESTTFLSAEGHEVRSDTLKTIRYSENRATGSLDTLRDFIANAFRSSEDDNAMLQEKTANDNAELSKNLSAEIQSQR